MKIQEIRGFCNFQDIYNAAVNVAVDGQLFVEVGSLWGSSTAYMADYIKQSRKNITFFAIDYFDIRGISAGVWSDEDMAYVRSLGGIVEDEDMCYNAYLKALTLCDLDKYVYTYRMSSEEGSHRFQNNSIDFLFIDAGHTYEDISNDLRCWYPKIKKNGIIAGHDYDWSSVKKAVDEFFPSQVKSIGTSWYVQPVTHA